MTIQIALYAGIITLAPIAIVQMNIRPILAGNTMDLLDATSGVMRLDVDIATRMMAKHVARTVSILALCVFAITK